MDGGGALGGCDSWCGGDGGYVSALIPNPNENQINVSVGSGGVGGDYNGNGNPESGGDGSVTVWVPPSAS